ncbi:MAG: hypothetical protein OWQ54_00365 [Sulfolobaceae archaeon]|nr:hypothetical protein [Sulfolobaceae archaeon]
MLTEEGKKALAIIKSIEDKNIVLPEVNNVQIPVILQYLDELEVTKGMLEKIRNEVRKLIIKDVNEVRFDEDIDVKLIEDALESIYNVSKIICPPQLLEVVSKKSKSVKSLVKPESGDIDELEEEVERIEDSVDRLLGNISNFLGGLASDLAGKVIGNLVNVFPSPPTVYDGPLT